MQLARRLLLLAPALLLPRAALAQIITPSSGFGLRPLFATGTSVGNGADLTEDTLQTYTMPANTLVSVGDRLHIFAGGVFASSTDTKTIKVKFGSLFAANFQGTAANQTRWAVDSWIVKTGSNAQSYATFAGAFTTIAGTANGTTTQTETSTIAIVVTGQNATNSVANSVTCQYLAVDYYPAS